MTNPNVVQDLIKLRDEIAKEAFSATGQVINQKMAEVAWKINSCLFKGYPRTSTGK